MEGRSHDRKKWHRRTPRKRERPGSEQAAEARASFRLRHGTEMHGQYSVDGAVLKFRRLDQRGIRIYRKSGDLAGFMASRPDGYEIISDAADLRWLRNRTFTCPQALDRAVVALGRCEP